MTKALKNKIASRSGKKGRSVQRSKPRKLKAASPKIRKSKTPKPKSVLEMTHDEAREFFLKPESYSNVDLPDYLQFRSTLAAVEKALNGKSLKDLGSAPKDFEKVNHSMLSNKDGRHAWRPFQLIHPALYVSLASWITDKAHWETIRNRFGEFSALKNFRCLSIPLRSASKKRSDKAAQILQWWDGIEQSSISLALDYQFVFHADISDCYSSIYSHSISWALHGRDEAKAKRRDKSLIGNLIDEHIQDMRHGQTNGIPQGSVLMDFIAEMVLGYADLRLSEHLSGIGEYKILRYRDDYRIFVNDTSTGERILKSLTEVLIDLGLKLNASKTTGSLSVVSSSLKPDKREFMRGAQGNRDLRKHLLILHAHGQEFPNAGSLTTALSKFHRRIIKSKKVRDPIPLISIAIDIACNSPRTFPFCAAIVSKLLDNLEKTSRAEIIGKIHRKMTLLPNVGHMEVWLQRISHQHSPGIEFKEPLCRLVSGSDEFIWNNDWISSKTLKQALKADDIVDRKKLRAMKPVIQPDEIDLFSYY